MVVIGSTALCHYLDDITPKDLDLVGTYEEAEAFRRRFKATVFYPINGGKSIFMRNAAGDICEVEIAWEGSRADKFLKFLDETQAYTCNPSGYFMPDFDVLYLLKMSHRYLKDSPHFLKTMRDIHRMREEGAKILPEHQAFYEERMRDTYTNKLPKLNVNKSEFFDEVATGVVYKYDHDSLHEAVKHMPVPAYKYYKPDEAEVYCSKELFYECCEETRLHGILEEAYVLALERSLIPFPLGKTPKQAFDMALMKVCTSITSGWFREWAWENYYRVQELYDENYVDKFKRAVDNGTIKLNK